MSEYVYSHYPLARYRNGVYMAVANAEEEALALADGWTDWHSDQDRMSSEVASTTEQPSSAVAQASPDDIPGANAGAAPTPAATGRKKPGRKPKVQQS
jgi:hypothetical protein